MIAADTEVESDILDLFTDETGAIHVGAALTALLHVTAGLCCQATNQTPLNLATEFAVKLRQAVAQEQAKPRYLS